MIYKIYAQISKLYFIVILQLYRQQIAMSRRVCLEICTGVSTIAKHSVNKKIIIIKIMSVTCYNGRILFFKIFPFFHFNLFEI